MKTLDDAWKWYQDVKQSLEHLRRLGKRYWASLPWNDPLWKGDPYFVELTAAQIENSTKNGIDSLDDLAVLVLFSVFEASVRDGLLDLLRPESGYVQHPIFVRAIEDALQQVREGSFYYVFSHFKKLDSDLVEKVNQVRRYRNWVSHGKRGNKPAFVSPQRARTVLTECFELLFPSPPQT